MSTSIHRLLDKVSGFEQGWDGERAPTFPEEVRVTAKSVIDALLSKGLDSIDLLPDINGNIVVLVDESNYVARFDVAGCSNIRYELEVNDDEYPPEIIGVDRINDVIAALLDRVYAKCVTSEKSRLEFPGYESAGNSIGLPLILAQAMAASRRSAETVYATPRERYAFTYDNSTQKMALAR